MPQTTPRLLLASALVLLAPACSKKEPAAGAATGSGSGPGSGAGSSAAKPAEPPRPSGPFAAWDLEARRAAFQGAHLTPGGLLGSWEAWNVEGSKITVYDGKTEKVAELAILTPCTATITERSGGGSSSTTITYTVADGKLATGLGSAGSRKGAAAVACTSGAVFVLDANGTCTEWESDNFDRTKLTSKPGTCSFAKDDKGKEVFKATLRGSEIELDELHGDAMYTSQLWNMHSEKLADFAAAKAALDAKLKK